VFKIKQITKTSVGNYAHFSKPEQSCQSKNQMQVCWTGVSGGVSSVSVGMSPEPGRKSYKVDGWFYNIR
jgi:hypothetical protein